MAEKIVVDVRQVVINAIRDLNRDQFLNFVNSANNSTLSIDGKQLTEEELKAVTAFVRLMRGNTNVHYE